MLLSRLAVSLLPIVLLGMGAGVAFAQDYPNKPIRIYTGSAGGGSDLQSRLIASAISIPLGQPVIVQSQAGSQAAAAKAPPDGYTLLINGGGTWITPLLQPSTYDPVKDLAPITLISTDVNVIAVHPSVPAKSIKELIALAKARPGELNYGVGLPGSTGRLSAELFRSMAGIDIVRIPHKGGTQAITALVSGQVQILALDAGLLMPLAKAGKLRVLAVTSAEPSAMAPDLPTVASAGLPGYESVGMTGMLAPAKTPQTIINRLNQEVVRFLRTAEAKAEFSKLGTEVIDSTPEQFAAFIRSDIAKAIKLIKEEGIKQE